MTDPGASARDRSSTPRMRRVDAQRNHRRLLAAAKDVFDERGIDAPLGEVARRAGVGNATMYRHFPALGDLIVAVYADEVTAVCERGRSLLDATAADDALFDWLALLVRHVSHKRELVRAVPVQRGSTQTGSWHTAMRDAAAALLERAQRHGFIRANLTVTDALAVAQRIALTTQNTDQHTRLLCYCVMAAGCPMQQCRPPHDGVTPVVKSAAARPASAALASVAPWPRSLPLSPRSG
jgi:AcrR family transcriptional regulator